MILELIFFNDTATTEIYTLSLHDALPICAALIAATICRTNIRGRPGFDVVGSPAELQAEVPGRPRKTTGNQRKCGRDRKSTRLNSSHANISYAVFCLKKQLSSMRHPLTSS